MSKLDDLLQNQLEALENGQPMEKVLGESAEGAAELPDLVRLASAVRALPHPRPRLQRSHASRQRQAAPFWRLDWAQLRPALLLSGGLLTAMVVLVMFASLVGVGVWLAGPRQAQAATLMTVSGTVEVASSATAADWRLASDGFRVRQGQRVRTGEGASATLVFYEGSRAVLGAYTDITLRQLKGGWGRTLQLVLDQRMGETVHSVVPLRGENSRYHVNTPTGTASVHGTTFSVDVNLAGQSRFAVDEGQVQVSAEGSEVWLAAGQITAVEPGLAVLEPSYQSELQGVLQEVVGNTWMVDGVYFDLAEGAVVEGNPTLQDFVEVEGQVLSGGAFEAYRIKKTSGEAQLSFTGALDSMGDGTWVVNGSPLSVVEGVTVLNSDLQVNDTVEVTFEVQGNTWQALKIEGLAEGPTMKPSPGPILSLDKSTTSTGYKAVGEEITYSYTVTNNGSNTITGPFAVADDMIEGVNCDSAPESLGRGESFTCTASYMIQLGDILAGSVTNIAYATAENKGKPLASNFDSVEVNYVPQGSQLALEKSADPTEYSAVGDLITYTYTISNTGDTPITGPFSVSDDKTTVSCPVEPTSLAKGDSITCKASYTVSGADILAGSVTNVAYATAGNDGEPISSNIDTVTIYTSGVEKTQLDLDKSASPEHFYAVGDVIVYSYTLTNSGSDPINGPFTVMDDKILSGVDCSSAPASLAPGESFTCTASYTITGDDFNAGSVTNKAWATTPVESEPDTVTVTSLEIDCTGNDQHPKALKLAEEYGVLPEEIMGWFCQRFGFGEIDHAYSLAAQYGVTPAQLFALRQEGWGWGQIKNGLKDGSLLLLLSGTPSDDLAGQTTKPGQSNKSENGPPGQSNKPENGPPGQSNKPDNGPPGQQKELKNDKHDKPKKGNK